jgi:hypothetical protein
MALIDTNLNSEHLKDLLERSGDTATINYGYNSGGYEDYVVFYTKDAGTLAISTVIDQINEVDFTDDSDPQWFLIGYSVNYEDNDLTDSHTGEPIPAAYT